MIGDSDPLGLMFRETVPSSTRRMLEWRRRRVDCSVELKQKRSREHSVRSQKLLGIFSLNHLIIGF
jgi:hypothetical protein